MGNQQVKELFDAFKFPPGIMLCDWQKLTKAEKQELWDEYQKNRQVENG